jgi:hypothetical protein
MRSAIVAAVLAVSALFAAAPAMAGEHGKGGASFPMPAAAFQQKVTERQTKARAHMEERASKLSADEAKALRAKFAERTAKVNAEVQKAVADGTVTKDEAKAVRQASGHGHHHKGGKGKHAKKK